jgi:hypothetical protein
MFQPTWTEVAQSRFQTMGFDDGGDTHMMQYQRASFGLFHHKAVSFGEIMVS